jgi:hypothetical protein
MREYMSPKVIAVSGLSEHKYRERGEAEAALT